MPPPVSLDDDEDDDYLRRYPPFIFNFNNMLICVDSKVRLTNLKIRIEILKMI